MESWFMKGRHCGVCHYPVVVTQGKEADYRYYCSNPDCEQHTAMEDLYDLQDPPDWVWPVEPAVGMSTALHLEGQKILVDPELDMLLQALNAAGLKTTKSCSGHGEGPAWVVIAMDNIKNVELRAAGTRGPHQELRISWDMP